jgi:hypothetical protein
MNSMDNQEKEEEIEKLSNVLSRIQNLYYKKKDQLEDLQEEISELREVLNYLNSIVSHKSFHSAEDLLHKPLHKDELQPEDYFQEEIPTENAKGMKIKRKIFSKDQKELLCVLNYLDFQTIEIKFLNAETINIRETSEEFLSTFLRGALIPIKEKYPDMALNYNYLKDSNIIESIHISNINSIEDYDLISIKLRELLEKTYPSE